MDTSQSYQIAFSRAHPPPGIRDGEDILAALARLRKIVMSEIPVLGVTAVKVLENESIMRDGDIKSRIKPLIINDSSFIISPTPVPGKNVILDGIVRVRVTSGEIPLTVTTDNFKLSNNEMAPVTRRVPITALGVGKSFKADIYYKRGTVLKDGTQFSPVGDVTFIEEVNGDLLFIIELVGGFNDINYVMAHAYNIMGKPQVMKVASKPWDLEVPTLAGDVNNADLDKLLG